MSQIRRATIQDLPGVYRICLLTAAVGEDASSSYGNPDLLGHVFVGPYIVHSPELSRVVVDPEGVAGYVVGAADSRAFEAWAEAAWWPVLRAQYPALGDGTRDAEVIDLIHRPPLADPAIVVDYPSHLHINLLERARGHGLGRALIEWLVGELRSAGSRGVHLDVGAANHNAVAFYRHLGFEALVTGDDAIVMGMRLG
jgi:ribosomal protein S18 acetylase RimI-like enzyme